MANMMTQAGNNLGNAIGRTTSIMRQPTNTIANTDLSQYQNPYQRQVINRTMNDMDRARQMTQNDIGAQATAAGAFGGSRHGLVEAENNRNFANAAGDMAAQLRMQNFNNAQQMAQNDVMNKHNARGQRLSAANQLGGLAGQQFTQGRTVNQDLMNAGQQIRGIDQQLMDQSQNMFNQWSGAPAQSLTLPLAALGATPNVGTQSTSQDPGIFGTISAWTSVLPFLSDRRVKEDIKRVGQTDDGVPIYTYRYKGGDTFYMGVMAQEIEQVNPDAVTTMPNGMKAVYYDKVA